jgi:hypothetical protein
MLAIFFMEIQEANLQSNKLFTGQRFFCSFKNFSHFQFKSSHKIKGLYAT